ncbi:conserved phage C-terminal domain-containing protein [Enterococcus casseliflavus]|uniref:conserved phage C-terminal domain-containing protein n=1 Tax=Enterococcus casseliflavus TaxID=37734 RepID=UPI0022E72A82|nr:conserved phage C-terminal domain-containing protein [Enterococcus casseliflavus]
MAERKISKSNRGFKGVWIPSHIWLDKNLTIQEIRRCSQIINELKDKGYITVNLILNEKKQVERRTIRVSRKFPGGYQEYFHTPMEGKFQGSNTSFSNTKNNMSSKPDLIPYSEIITYLNNKSNKSFKVTQKWKDLIKARWNEGQRLDDFKKVIDVKTNQWLNNQEMNKYLRPATLFGNKFDDYLNEYRPQVNSSISDEIAESQRRLSEAYEQ